MRAVLLSQTGRAVPQFGGSIPADCEPPGRRQCTTSSVILVPGPGVAWLKIVSGCVSHKFDSMTRVPSRTRQERALEAVDVEELKRRCAAHDQWMATHPPAVAASETWAARNCDELAHNAADALRRESHLNLKHREPRTRAACERLLK